MNRFEYFEKLKSVRSPLLHFNAELDSLISAAAGGQTGSLTSYADRLESSDHASAKARAAFIRLQCKSIDTQDLFEEFRESWGIPIFDEDLVTVDDFKNGFLFTFRDHSSSWNENDEAREWFYTNPEALFARRYEFWARDHGPEEMILLESGPYKDILWSIVKKHVDYTPFISPSFSHQELQEFFEKFDELEYDFEKPALQAIMEQNINWIK